MHYYLVWLAFIYCGEASDSVETSDGKVAATAKGDAHSATASLLRSTTRLLRHQQVGTAFDFSKKSCDVHALKLDAPARATRIKTSSTGNMGGVFFVALVEPDCNIVVKPKVDIHDVYASALGEELDVSVVQSKVIKKESLEWHNLLEAFADDPAMRDRFLLFSKESAFLLVMAMAEGKDMYRETDITFGWKTCDICTTASIDEQLFKKFEVHDMDSLPACVAADMVARQFKRPYTAVCKAVWAAAVAEEPSRNKTYWNRPDAPKTCPPEWGKTDVFSEDVALYARQHHDDFFGLLADEFARTSFSTRQKSCPREMKPAESDVNRIRMELKAAYDSVSTQADMAKLSAFSSLICENDGISAFGHTMSNYGNVFLSDKGAMGIDMAVGGGASHALIDPKTHPDKVNIAFAYGAIENAAKIATCGDEQEIEHLSRQFVGKMARPYSNFDKENTYQECARDRGNVLLRADVTPEAIAIVMRWPGEMRSALKDSSAAITKTTSKLMDLDPDGVGAVDKWLRFHVEKLRDSFDKGSKACEGQAPPAETPAERPPLPPHPSEPSGLEAEDMCSTPPYAELDGYDVTLCDTTEGAILTFKCDVTCAVGYYGEVDVTCDHKQIQEGIFRFSGCHAREPPFIVQATLVLLLLLFFCFFRRRTEPGEVPILVIPACIKTCALPLAVLTGGLSGLVAFDVWLRDAERLRGLELPLLASAACIFCCCACLCCRHFRTLRVKEGTLPAMTDSTLEFAAAQCAEDIRLGAYGGSWAGKRVGGSVRGAV